MQLLLMPNLSKEGVHTCVNRLTAMRFREPVAFLMDERLKGEFPGCEGPEEIHIAAAYTGSREDAQEWLEELQEAFPGYPIHMDPLSLSVACHIGPGARAVTYTRALHI